ncbi:hypothetical protein ACFL5Z_09600 [Planctomycetota bacterium]
MSDVSKLYELIKRYRLDWRHPKELKRVVKRIEKGRMRPEQAKRRLKKIRPLIEQQIREGNYLPMPPTMEDLQLDEEPFEIVLGNLVERPEVPFGLSISTGVHHIIICGKPSAGKSVTLKVYFKKVHDFGLIHPEYKTTFVFFDYKNDLPNPQIIFGENFKHVKVRDPANLRFALDPPPGVPISAWAAVISTALGARLNLIVSRTCLATIYKWVTPLLNRGSPTDPIITPSLELILDLLTNSPANCWGEKTDYIRVLTQMVHAALVDADGMFDAETGFSVIDALSKGVHCVINIANLEPPYLRYLICDIILLQLLTYHIHNHLKTTRARICLAFDEADFFTQSSAQATYPQLLSPLTQLARLSREYGIQIVIAVSGLQNVAPYLLTSADCHIIHGSVDSESMWQIKNTLGIEKGAEKLLPSLRNGKCVFRNTSLAYPYPMLGQVEFVEPDHSQKSRPYDSIPFTKSRRLKDLPRVQEALQIRISERRNATLRQSKAKKPMSLSKTERAFLDHLSLKEYEPVNIIFSRIGDISAGVQRQAIKKLEKLTFVKTTPRIRTGRIFVRFVSFTDEGRKYMNK